jgi:antitoxin CptB
MALTHANALCEVRLSAYMTATSRRRWRRQLEPSSARTGYQSRSFMTDAAETRRRRAAYRATHRGTKEMDWALGRFAEQALAGMVGARLAAFEELLELPDPVLNEMVMDGVPVADEEIAALIAEIRAFHGLGGDASPSPRSAGRGSG